MHCANYSDRRSGSFANLILPIISPILSIFLSNDLADFCIFAANNVYIFIEYQLKGPTLSVEKIEKTNFEKNVEFSQPLTGCPKNSAQSVQPFGRLYATYIFTNVLFYYLDLTCLLGFRLFVLHKRQKAEPIKPS